MLYVGIGAGVGGFLLILSVVFITFFVKRRRSTKSNTETKNDTYANNEIELSSPPLDITYGTPDLAKQDPHYAPIAAHASYGSLDPLRDSKIPETIKKVGPPLPVPKRPSVLNGKKEWVIDWSELAVTSEIGKGGISLAFISDIAAFGVVYLGTWRSTPGKDLS